jgi:hypothetical protein
MLRTPAPRPTRRPLPPSKARAPTKVGPHVPEGAPASGKVEALPLYLRSTPVAPAAPATPSAALPPAAGASTAASTSSDAVSPPSAAAVGLAGGATAIPLASSSAAPLSVGAAATVALATPFSAAPGAAEAPGAPPGGIAAAPAGPTILAPTAPAPAPAAPGPATTTSATAPSAAPLPPGAAPASGAPATTGASSPGKETAPGKTAHRKADGKREGQGEGAERDKDNAPVGKGEKAAMGKAAAEGAVMHGEVEAAAGKEAHAATEGKGPAGAKTTKGSGAGGTGGGGGGAGGGAVPAAAGGDSGGSEGGAEGGGDLAAAEASGDSAQAQAQEKVEEKLEQATPAHDEEEIDAGAPAAAPEAATAAAAAPTPENMAKASEAADAPALPISGDEAEGAAEGAEASAEPPAPGPEPEAAELNAPAADPEALDRAQSQLEARDAQRGEQRAAEASSDEHAQDQAEDRAESGEAPAGGAELSGGERDTGLASVAEPVEGGGSSYAAAGGGGGDAGAAKPVPAPEPAPDTANSDPESGLAAAATLQPMQTAKALDGVGASIDTTAKSEGESLQSEIPAVEVGGDGSGGSAVVAAPESSNAKALEDKATGEAQAVPEPEPAPEPGPAPTAGIAAPSVADTQEGTVRREDAARVADSVESMPTTDPTMDTSAGPAPPLQKTGDADPAQMTEQRGELDRTIADQKTQGAADVSLPAGEKDVRDRTPRSALPGPKLAAPGGGAAGVPPADDESVGIVAEQKQGDEVRAAMAQAQGDMAAKRGEHQDKVAEEKSKSDAEIAKLKSENAAQQQAEKAKVNAEVGKARGDWSAEQNAEIKKTNDKATQEIAKGNEDIAKEETKGNENANKELTKGEADAKAEKDKAEKEAAEKKREAERKKREESGGIFGWIASKVSAFFDALKNAITKVFDLAKAAIKKAIDAAKKLALAAIELARKAIVGLIKLVGKALMALGDVLLAAFPGLKKKWRAFIESKVKAAEDAVNALADALKKGVTKLLDALGKAFEFLLALYKKAMLAVLDVAKGVAMAAVKAAKAVADALGTWVAIIKDIASGPLDWLSKLGSAAKDGIKNHLWGVFQRDVKQWFNDKLQEVLGLGGMVWAVLRQGGIAMGDIGTMVFEALKAAIPAALIQLLIEKLVAMIVPAAGAVMAIIEGLQAAWGTVQRILSAIGKFITFLKAVKGGGAGPQFADMLSTAAIVVIDFVANWLLKRLRKPASKVGGKIKAIAQKIMAKVKAAAKKVGGAFKKAGAKTKGALAKGKKKFSDWRARREAKKDAKKGKDKKDPHKKKQDKEAAKRERLRKAVAALQPKVDALARKGKLSGILLKIRLLAWKARYRLSSLRVNESGGSATVVAKVNPSEEIRKFVAKFGAQLRKMIYAAAEKIMNHPEVLAAADKANAIVEGQPSFTDAEGNKRLDPKVESGADSLAVAKKLSEKRKSGTKSDVTMGRGSTATVKRDPANRSKDPAGAPPGLQHVEKAGAYVNHPQEFKQAAAAAGVTEKHLHEATVGTFLGGTAIAGASKEVKDFGAQQALLKICEISRNPAGGLISLDTATEAAKGKIDTAAGVAADPMSGVSATDKRLNPGRAGYNERVAESLREPDPNKRAQQVESKGAVATAGRAQKLAEVGKEPTGKARRVRRVIQQHLDFVARVLQAEYEVGRIMFTDETKMMVDLETQIQKAILRRFQELTGLPDRNGW